ncbi:MAG: acyl--CoA ligase [Clostridia bacterium]|nr:acyl--CoA ligase [Clostridia bacterium]
MSLWAELNKAFQTNAGLPAITNPDGECLCYGELHLLIKGLAKKICAAVPQGAYVAILNTHPFYDAICIIAAFAAGCTAVPMSLSTGEKRCKDIIDIVAPQLLLTNMRQLPEMVTEAVADKKTLVLYSKEFGRGGDWNPTSTLSNELAMILFTSGTNGKPKGVMLSHANILNNAKDIQDYLNIGSKDHMLILRPLCLVSAINAEFLVAMLNGVRVSFYSDLFMPQRLLGFMQRMKCTVMTSTPTMLYQLVLCKSKVDLPALRKVGLSSEHAHSEIVERLREVFPDVEFYTLYGLTEASPRVTYLPPEFFGKKNSCSGIPLKSVQIKIVDQYGNEVRAGKEGEIIVKGPNIMVGYWKDSQQTSEKIRNGWLYTGDLGYIDEEGFLYVIGRKDDMIIRAGTNIYPQELENLLLQSKYIKEVVAWGEPNPKYGQKICIEVVPENAIAMTNADVMALCRQYLQFYQLPDEVYVAEFLKRNATGKLIRKKS